MTYKNKFSSQRPETYRRRSTVTWSTAGWRRCTCEWNSTWRTPRRWPRTWTRTRKCSEWTTWAYPVIGNTKSSKNSLPATTAYCRSTSTAASKWARNCWNRWSCSTSLAVWAATKAWPPYREYIIIYAAAVQGVYTFRRYPIDIGIRRHYRRFSLYENIFLLCA